MEVTYRSIDGKIPLRTWMTQRQLHHQKVHPCLGNRSPKQHPWSLLQDMQTVQHIGKSPTGRLAIWKEAPLLSNCLSFSNLGGFGKGPHASCCSFSRLSTFVYFPRLRRLSPPSQRERFSWRTLLQTSLQAFFVRLHHHFQRFVISERGGHK